MRAELLAEGLVLMGVREDKLCHAGSSLATHAGGVVPSGLLRHRGRHARACPRIPRFAEERRSGAQAESLGRVRRPREVRRWPRATARARRRARLSPAGGGAQRHVLSERLGLSPRAGARGRLRVPGPPTWGAAPGRHAPHPGRASISRRLIHHEARTLTPSARAFVTVLERMRAAPLFGTKRSSAAARLDEVVIAQVIAEPSAGRDSAE